MSQLDWLWTTYSPYNVANEASDTPSERLVLTEKAITSLIQEATNGGITNLVYEEDPDDTTRMRLVGNAINGAQLTLVYLPKEEHIMSFVSRAVTQTDVDNGCTYDVGTTVLAITTNLDNTYLVNVAELDIKLSGSETNTVLTEVISGVVTSNVKIDANNNSVNAVSLNTTSNGIYAKLKIADSSSGVNLEADGDGLRASIQIGSSSVPLQFDQMTLDEYLAVDAAENTLYFITDYPYVYLNGVRYGVNILPGEYSIVSLTYDADSMKLYYKKSDGSDIQYLALGPVSSTANGMMTSAQYESLQALIAAVDSITSVSDYVAEQVKTAAFSIEKGEAADGQVPVYLKDGNGNVISTMYLDEESYLSTAEQRAATIRDVVNAEDKGVTISEGDQILVLTLITGDVVYVNLTTLADVYAGASTNTIATTVSNGTITADVILPEDEHILYESVNGLATRISVKQGDGKICVYGKTETDDDLLGSFVTGDALLGMTVLHDYDASMRNTYPPAKVNGADYDYVTNPVYDGYTYVVLTMGMDTGDTSTSYSYNLYLDVTSFLDEIKVSEDEDNILTMGTDGHLYATVAWNDVD